MRRRRPYGDLIEQTIEATLGPSMDDPLSALGAELIGRPRAKGKRIRDLGRDELVALALLDVLESAGEVAKLPRRDRRKAKPRAVPPTKRTAT